MQISKTRKMAECAMMIALGTILSYFIIFSLPMGGTITAFSQVPLILIGYRHGWKWGAFSGVVFGLLQMVLQGLGNFAYVKTLGAYLILIFFDYVLAFGVLGLSGAFFRRLKNQPLGIGLGAATGSALRFLCHFISGVTIWGEYANGWQSVWVYSLAYNGSYMLVEGIVTVVGVVALALVLNFKAPNLKKVRQ